MIQTEIILEKTNVNYPLRCDYYLKDILEKAEISFETHYLCRTEFFVYPNEMDRLLTPERIFNNSFCSDLRPKTVSIFPGEGLYSFKKFPDFKYLRFHVDTVDRILNFRFILIPVSSKKKDEFVKWLIEEAAHLEHERRKLTKKKDYLDRLFLKKDVKERIIEKIELFLDNREFYIKHKIPWKLGILLYGPPGNGKTLLIKALSEHFKLITVDLTRMIKNGTIDMEEKEVSTEPAMEAGPNRYDCYRMVYAKPTPKIYYIEDLDKKVFSRAANDIPVLPVGELLQTLDGVEEINNVIIIATTNYVKDLVEAITARPGRFDIVQEIGNPDEKQIKSLFNYYNFKYKDLNTLLKDLRACSMSFVESFVKECILKYKKLEFDNYDEIRNVLVDIHKHIRLKKELQDKIGFF